MNAGRALLLTEKVVLGTREQQNRLKIFSLIAPGSPGNSPARKHDMAGR
jgi:hypothetical protein